MDFVASDETLLYSMKHPQKIYTVSSHHDLEI